MPLPPRPGQPCMLMNHTTTTTSAIAAQLKQQTLDLREEAELAKRSLNVIVKHFDPLQDETSETLALAFENKILVPMALTGKGKPRGVTRLPRSRGKAGPSPLLLTFDTMADKMEFLKRRKRLGGTSYTLDDDLTLTATTATRAMADRPTSSSGRRRGRSRSTGRGRTSTSPTSPGPLASGRRPLPPQPPQPPQPRECSSVD
eukprot:jgi/Mesvir1/15118/Mv25496-RA.1